ncbi:MAG TPA: hypothetical protein PKL16_02295 [Anaerolineae bacterium]|nr:hypothetical protein [Anaerolineae bacterium]HQM13116.1 hypothetical protein [Anaerolineae bacterium]
MVILGRRTAEDLPEALAVEEGADDVLVRLPLPRWDVWYLPLLAHAYGFWIAKRGRSAALEAFVAAREAALVARFDLGAGACDAAEAALWLPEVSSLAMARPEASDLGARDDRQLLLQRQRLHLWHFPDAEIWNLPLMAHEFGHVAALNTPAFLEFLARQVLTLVEGHPKAESWTRQQRESYVSQRSAHLHEFFADAFALYCQGPAFAFDMTPLHLNPAEALLRRGRHPTHAERFEVLLTVLERMNSAAQADVYALGPYAPAIARLKDLWTQAVAACGVQPDAVATFHRLQARRLARELYEGLEQSYRLGAQFPPEAWQQAYEAAPAWNARRDDL